MSKFKNTFMIKIEDDIKEEQEQANLHKKYKHIDENVKIVEKNNNYKFTIKTIASIIRILSNIILYVFATIGLTSLIIIDTRVYLIDLFFNIINTYF
ncbi:hypothetical protein [Anaerofustis butyriciformans]|uniref:hypothetical protein n=1 Tax=Anaerofustis butyriciformans TaxID=3108533 RepID=UPI002E34ED3D|nr:hypothetical protein [Anaerofustis sp. HA2171]